MTRDRRSTLTDADRLKAPLLDADLPLSGALAPKEDALLGAPLPEGTGALLAAEDEKLLLAKAPLLAQDESLLLAKDESLLLAKDEKLLLAKDEKLLPERRALGALEPEDLG